LLHNTYQEEFFATIESIFERINIGTYPNKIFRRVFGLFWPIFDFKLGELYTTVDIAPHDLNGQLGFDPCSLGQLLC
jgi:hypothetical protein